MNKKQMINQLEGRWVQTADGNWHLVQDGKFTAANGEVCYLRSYEKCHVRIFLDSSRADSPCNHVPFSQDLEYQHNAYFRDYYKCRVCGAEVSRPEHRFGGYVGFP